MPGHVFTQPHIVRSSAQKRSKDEQMDMNESGQWSREVNGWKVTLVLTPEVSLQLCGLCCHHLSSLLLLFRSPLSGLLFSGTHTAGLQMMTKCRQCIDKSGKCVFFSCFLATSIQPPPLFLCLCCLSTYTNWHGVTFLPQPAETFTILLLNRVQ